jgi:hypothetical protein
MQERNGSNDYNMDFRGYNTLTHVWYNYIVIMSLVLYQREVILPHFLQMLFQVKIVKVHQIDHLSREWRYMSHNKKPAPSTDEIVIDKEKNIEILELC